MNCKIALTGATGNMGLETLDSLYKLDCVNKIKILVLPEDIKTGKRLVKKYKDKVELTVGDIALIDVCRKLVVDVDYVLNLAAVIPPKSDKSPVKSERCNYIGAKNIVDSIAELKHRQPKLLHISTVALYGNRDYKHPWGRVGDPLIPSAYDAYAVSKLRGERYVLESGLDCWTVLRQTAMLHNRMLTDNLSDGLMFHTCYNCFLEWVTARDSGKLLAKIIARDMCGELGAEFWKKCFNIGGGADNRVTGYDTFDGGFKIIGGSTEKFMKPDWNITRNFHGLWFYDGDVLENMFGYQKETFADYWQKILSTHKYYAAAKILPPSLISRLAVQRLLKDANSPKKWNADGDFGKIHACFGDGYNSLPKSWADFPLVQRGKTFDGGQIDYNALKDKSKACLLSHGYDESKPDCELDISDMQRAAAFRGGKLITDDIKKGDVYTPVQWECAEGHRFFATPFTVLKAGHWCAECADGYVWDYNRLAKKNPFYAQIWYDTHEKKENIKYYFDADFKSQYKYIEE